MNYPEPEATLQEGWLAAILLNNKYMTYLMEI
jgi:hypothetical protein